MQVPIISLVAGLVAGGGAVGAGFAFGLALSPGFIGVCIALGVTVGVLLLVSARVIFIHPLAELRDTIRAMHKDGDLSRRVSVSAGQVGEVEAVFNELISSFQGIVGKVIFDAQRVHEAADLLSGHAGQVADGSSNQQGAAECMVAAIEQMTHGVNVVAEHASQTAANAQVARDLSVKGAEVVTSASREIEQIARSVESSAKVISALGERSEAISGIVKVIREIADQTNLLALNAAIEAARAGEQGRGFAVVADEVRKLAERTSAATTEIGMMISAIQMETRSAIASIDAGSAQAHAGAELAQKAAGSLQQINEGARQTMEKVDAIAAAINTHSREADQIVGHVRQIMDMVGRNSAGAKETLSEATSLSGLAVNLKEISRVFKLGAAGELAMTVHKKMPDIVRDGARQMGMLLEQAIAGGQLSEADLFDDAYRPIPNTRPQKYSSRFDSLTDRIFPVLQERLLDSNPEVVYAIGTDQNGYVPTHNKRFSQPLTGDYDKDFVGNRSKRVFDDPVGKQCGKHEMPFLIQTYRRDTGEIMHDISAPVYVNGRHWGGFRIGYRA
ncbi:methyl-accepting chemotaxis protein [Zoogloea sp.]|jgi:methyl-accepting chemotaxis protein|uniref:methyl-accepting chemotaxis protein n=1 Tax=Zoogloea sp. TaxID=49181 RepID=UPI0011DC254F|nr:methyl-accepting chemotaxis protein [Zoogloea sp.]MBK6656226.1 methyl-accepting chemotaxis protein [Zoogloea sp.]MBP7443484.1 methyl-accepting chemotaxis protein [Zoogloea sp.]TXG97491.1 MAG: methyl-accepting chemotaxis protein [Zoogloea sp.]HOY00448.1 methyl-accepting chemotaxis protein [Zoogloea sp.]